MKTSAMVLSYCYLLVSLCYIVTASKSNDGSNDTSIQAPSLNTEDYIQENTIALTSHEADEIWHKVEQLANVHDDQEVLPFSPLSLNRHPVTELTQDYDFPGMPFQYLPQLLKEEKNMIPSQDALRRTLVDLLRPPRGFDFDDVDNSNVKPNIFNLDLDSNYPVFNEYRSRKQSFEEELLEQLEHDAIIKNILPTMDEPFYRDAGAAAVSDRRELQLPSLTTFQHLLAHYPTGYGFPIAIALRCTPKISRGYQQKIKLSPLNEQNVYLQSSNYTTCPDGEVLGYNFRCIKFPYKTLSNDSHWLNY